MYAIARDGRGDRDGDRGISSVRAGGFARARARGHGRTRRPTLFSEQTDELILITGKILNHRTPSPPRSSRHPFRANDRAARRSLISLTPFRRFRTIAPASAITRRLIMRIIIRVTEITDYEYHFRRFRHFIPRSGRSEKTRRWILRSLRRRESTPHITSVRI